MKNATLIYNPVAGGRNHKREKQMREAAGILKGFGIAVRVERTSEPGNASGIARAAADRGEKLIVVCGGDGTINEVINGITPGEITLGILPGGTANILAKEVRLPHDPIQAARELPSWTPSRIALGQVTWSPSSPHRPQSTERRYFLSVAGVGFDAYIVQNLQPHFARSLGVIAYGCEAVRQCLRYSFPSFICGADGRESPATFVVVERTSRYAGWLHLAPTASLFEDSFRVCMFKSESRARYFVYAAAVMARRHRSLSDVEIVECRRVECRSESSHPPIHFELDGEVVGELPATFDIVPGALTLLVPQNVLSAHRIVERVRLPEPAA